MMGFRRVIWVRIVLTLFLPVLQGQYYPQTPAASSPAPTTPNNPFLLDPSASQLALWGVTHPNGSLRKITSNAGAPLPSITTSKAIGTRGPILFDHVLLSRLAALNRRRIPERPVHSSGHGAFGTFTVLKDVSKYTKAKVFNGIGKTTKILVRFSSQVGESGRSETLPDPRAFAIRFYTEDGNLDFPGAQNWAFSVRDPMVFVDAMRAMKRNPQTHAYDDTMFHDFLSQRPEITANYIRNLADNARPGSSRAINGSAVNVYECVNNKGEYVYCKFHWLTWQNIPPLSDVEALTLAGVEPKYYTKDLYNNIATGNYPKWTFVMQVMTPEQAESLPFNPFDPTKVWGYEEFPYHPIGVFALTENPTDFFSQIESAAFCPSFVPGIRVSPDRILQARLFAYPDSHRHRLGPNFHLIEVNRPLNAVNNYDRDGAMRLSPSDNGDGGPNYSPNSFNGPTIDPEAAADEHVFHVDGVLSRVDSRDEDNFTQTRQFLAYDVGVDERARIIVRLARELSEVKSKDVIARVLVNCLYPISREFGDSVVRTLRVIQQGQAYSNNTVASYY